MKTVGWLLAWVALFSFWALGLAGWSLGALLVWGPWRICMDIHNQERAGSPRADCKTCRRYKAVTNGFARARYACIAWPFRSQRKAKV